MVDLLQVIKNYKLVDLSRTISTKTPRHTGFGMPFAHIQVAFLERDGFDSFMLLMSEHQGTHLDAPGNQGGTIWADEIPLEELFGPCCVLHFNKKPAQENVTLDEVKAWEKKHGEIKKGEIVLFSLARESTDLPGIAAEVCNYLFDKGIRAIGVDISTIENSGLYWTKDGGRKKYGSYKETAHLALLPRNATVVEYLHNLDKLPPRGALFIGFPLKIEGGSASPMRAVALVPK